jgi:hypothetical protein
MITIYDWSTSGRNRHRIYRRASVFERFCRSDDERIEKHICGAGQQLRAEPNRVSQALPQLFADIYRDLRRNCGDQARSGRRGR